LDSPVKIPYESLWSDVSREEDGSTRGSVAVFLQLVTLPSLSFVFHTGLYICAFYTPSWAQKLLRSIRCIGYIVLNDRMSVNFDIQRMWSWPVLRYCPSSHLQELRKTTKLSVRIAILQAGAGVLMIV
jgi:hypothetical protein